MSQRRQESPRRRIPPWMVYLLLALGAIAIVANAAWFMRRPQLAPLPEIAIEGLEPEVAAIIETARGNVRADEKSAQAWGDLGAVLRAHDLGLEANVCFRNAELLAPGDYRWPYLLGVSLTATDTEAALAGFRRASALAGDQPHVHLRLAEALASRGLNAEAEAIVDRVLAKRPKEPRAQLIKARLLLEQGNLKDSRSWAEKSAAGAPDKRATHLLLAQVCRRLGDKAGQEQAEAAVAELPDGLTAWPDPDLETVLGLRRDRAHASSQLEQRSGGGHISGVTDMLSKLAKGDPSVDAAIGPVQSYLEQGRLPQAEAMLRKLLPRHDESERLHFQLGVLCYQQKRYQPAADEFRRVIALKPDHVDANYNLGHALLSTGDAAAAADAFGAAVRLDPSHVFARINLARLLLAAGNRAEARQQLEIALRLAPNDPDAQKLWRQVSGQEN